MIRLARVESQPRLPHWRIEVPTLGVVLIDVSLGVAHDPPPLHWMCGDGRKPPLDVVLAESGSLLELQFVLQDERVPEVDSAPPVVDSREGLPVFDTEDWPHDRHRVERTPVSCGRAPGGELWLRIGGTGRPVRAIQPGPGLTLRFAEGAYLAEVVVGPLTLDDWDAIDTFSSVEMDPEDSRD